VRGPADAVDAAVGLVDHLSQVELGRVGGQPLDTSQARWRFSQACVVAAGGDMKGRLGTAATHAIADSAARSRRA
jgi:hypothetical protein